MSASDCQILLASEQPAMLADLADALRRRGMTASALGYAQAEARLDAAASILLLPTLAQHGQPDSWTAVAQELTRSFCLIQSFVRAAVGRQAGGHVVALLPAAAAMGDPADHGMSALAGGMLSLVRTLALEFRKLGMSANALLFEQTGVSLAHSGEIAALAQALVSQPGHAVSGQSIFAWAGADAGRLHP